MRLKLCLAALCSIAFCGGPTLESAELPTRRIDIHVDGGRPLAGERSRFVVSPQGDVYFTYTLAAGEFACKPLGIINSAGEIRLSAIDSVSTWNVEGWSTYGYPFDFACDARGELHFAARHRGPPYGVDYWRRVDGVWRMESFAADVTYGGNNVSLRLLPDGHPVVVCLDRNRTRLTVWERSDDGVWLATRPTELTNVASGQFDLEVQRDGTLHVVFCPTSGGPICATRNAQKLWAAQEIAATPVSRMIASTLDAQDRLHVAFASGKTGGQLQTLTYARLSTPKSTNGVASGKWETQPVSNCDEDRHVGRLDIAAADSVAIAWEQGAGQSFAPKDYGGKVGSVMLTVVGGRQPTTHKLVPKDGGRPGLALSRDGKTAWVGVYTGNDKGDDFYLLNCQLAGGKPIPAKIVSGDPASMFRQGCLNDINSGNAQAQRRGLQQIDMSGLSEDDRRSLIDRFLDHPDPRTRMSVVRELAKDPAATAHFAGRLPQVLDDSDRLVRKTFLEQLGASEIERHVAQPVFEKALASDDATTRLAAAEVVRQHVDWVGQDAFRVALKRLVGDLASENTSVAGASALALERLSRVPGTLDELRTLSQAGLPLVRVRAALVLFRAGEKLDWTQLDDVPKRGGEQAQLALCGLLGQVRSERCVPLLAQTLASPFPKVRTASVYALRSIAHVADLKPVAKHPHGFDLVALRAVEPTTSEQQQSQRAAVDVLVAALAHADPNVRQQACDALNRAAAKRAAAAIERLHDDPDPGVQIAARTAVGILNERPSSEFLIDHQKWKQSASERAEHRLRHVDRRPTALVDGVVQASSDKQLLIDDYVIEKMTGLARRLHPFQKHARNPVFQAQVPWEEGWADPFMSSVVYDRDERCFKLWYRCGPRHSLNGYAVSSDGVHWERPDIAVSPWQEFPHHNLLGFSGQIATWRKPANNVLYFPEATGTDRFVSLFYQPRTKDYAVSRSADGVDWQPPQAVRHAYGDVVSLVWDPARGQFLFFPKYNRAVDGFTRRSFAAATLKTLDAPLRAEYPFVAGHTDDARVAEDAGRAYGSLLPDTLRLRDFHSEIYSVTAMSYEGVVVALYDLWPVIGSAEGPLDMPMKVSRDMQTWQAVDYPRRALSIGQFGEWDSGMVYGSSTMMVVDDQIRLYYLGANMGHCTRVLPTTKPYHALGVGLATLRLDGFASLQPSAETGQLTTKPLDFSGDRLRINGRCRQGGSIRVELLDASGKPLPGYALADCDPFTGDSIRHTVTWNNKPAIAQEGSGPIRLRIVLSSADLFAFQFDAAAGDTEE